MPANATKTAKNGSKPQAKKSAAKKNPVLPPVSLTPLLDAAKLNNPHNAPGAGGWDKTAALALAVECGTFLASHPNQPFIDAVRIIDQYKSFCGWGNAIQASSIGLGVTKPTRKLAMAPVTAK